MSENTVPKPSEVEDPYELDPEDILGSPSQDGMSLPFGWDVPSKTFSRDIRIWLRPRSYCEVASLEDTAWKAQEALVRKCGKSPEGTLFLPIWRRLHRTKSWEQLPGGHALLDASVEECLIRRARERCGTTGIYGSGYPRVFLTAFPGRRAQPVVRDRRGNCVTLIRLLRDLPELQEVYPACRKVSQNRLGFHYLAHSPLVLFGSLVVPMAFKHGAKATRRMDLLYYATQYQGVIEAMNRSPLETLYSPVAEKIPSCAPGEPSSSSDISQNSASDLW